MIYKFTRMWKHAPCKLFVLVAALALPGAAAFHTAAYGQGAPPVLPDHTVYGRLGIGTGSGPAQAIPFATFGKFIAPGGSAYVTPQQFGAVCDGVTDDTAGLQAAMDVDAPIFLPVGSNCLFSSDLTYTGTGTKEVFSSGRAGATLTMTSAGQNGLVRTNGNFHIHDLTITTNIAKTNGAAILMKGPSNNVAGDLIMNCNILGDTSTGLYIGIDNETDVIVAIIDNYIRSAKVAGLLLNSLASTGGNGGESLILGNDFNTNLTPVTGSAGMILQTGSLSIRITNNLFESYDFGIELTPQNGISIQAIITANVFQSVGGAVFATPVGTAAMDTLLINGNYFNPASFSILTEGASNWITKTNIIGNTFNYGVAGTIHLAAGTLANIASNTFNASGVNAILFDAAFPAGVGLIHDNIFNNTGGSNSVILSGNPTAIVKNNPGYNPLGIFSVSPGASPFTYTPGNSPETLYMSASGGIAGVLRAGAGVLPAVIPADTTFTMDVDALDPIVIGYTGTLTLHRMIH